MYDSIFKHLTFDYLETKNKKDVNNSLQRIYSIF